MASSRVELGAVRRESRLLRVATVTAGLMLITVGLAAAVSHPMSAPAATPANVASTAGASELLARIAALLVPLLPAGVRVGRVALECAPPPGATLGQVAPGITQLDSRGFVVEFRSGARTFACGANVEARRRVLVAAHEISAGEALSAADFQLGWTEAFSGAPGALAGLPGPGPFVAATTLHAGEPLLPTQLTRPMAIHPGDLVTVLVRNGPVTVRTRLEARSAAAVGDNATVINPESGMPVTVVVTGDKSAELMMQ